MAWILIVVAGLLEVAWATGLRYTDGFSRPLPSLLVLIGIVGSMGMLAVASRDLPLGTAYAVWVGIGASGVALLGAAFYGEPLSAIRVLFLGLVITGIIGLKVTAPEEAANPNLADPPSP